MLLSLFAEGFCFFWKLKFFLFAFIRSKKESQDVVPLLWARNSSTLYLFLIFKFTAASREGRPELMSFTYSLPSETSSISGFPDISGLRDLFFWSNMLENWRFLLLMGDFLNVFVANFASARDGLCFRVRRPFPLLPLISTDEPSLMFLIHGVICSCDFYSLTVRASFKEFIN